MQGSLSIERMCQLAQVSRAGFYRSLQEQNAGGRRHGSAVGDSADRAGASAPLWLPEDHGGTAATRDAGESQAGGADHAGRQPAGGAAAGLRGDHGFAHELEVYLNLASRMKLTGINQLWVADITYIRLQRSLSTWR